MLLTILGTKLMASDDEESSFVYGCLSPYSIGGGRRCQDGKHGYDFSAHLIPLIQVNAIHLKGSYLHYPNNKGFYIGGGLGAMFGRMYISQGTPSTHPADFTFGTIEGTAGYQWKTEKQRNLFVEFNLTHLLQPDPIIPLPCVTFGVSF